MPAERMASAICSSGASMMAVVMVDGAQAPPKMSVRSAIACLHVIQSGGCGAVQICAQAA